MYTKELMAGLLVVTLWGGVLPGCTSELQLRPAPVATATPGRGSGAVQVEEGVRLEARADAWTGTPEELDEEVTPFLVRLDNDSERPLRIRYDQFVLEDAEGDSYAALPPFDIQATVTQQVETLAYPMHNFYVAPHLASRYPVLSPFSGVFVYDPLYYETYYRRVARIELPTADMVSLGLPEGVLEPGGRVWGFLYFEKVDDDTERLSFEAKLVDAKTGEVFGELEIPFEAR